MIDSVTKLRCPLILVFFTSVSFINGQDEVDLNWMKISGTTITTRNGRNISAFLGIPYALPPKGLLRFRNPIPWRPDDVYDDVFLSADKDGNECPQLNEDGKLIGDEDCLILNIYTPSIFTENTTEETIYPVMVYFHGAYFFVRGSGSSINAGPEYLLDRDIVLVTVNYRLGALGFLSTGDNHALGNFGLKDQILALEWIQKNIISFGGNPSRVTIFGQCGGGASTSLHAIFAPENLFNQFISQSGNALAFWAFEDTSIYLDRAIQLGKYMKCPTYNSKALVACLREAKAYDLVNSNDIFRDGVDWSLRTWGPTLENRKYGGTYITDVPLHTMMMMRKVKRYRGIIGNVFDEGLIWTAAYYANDTLYNSIKENLLDYVTYVVAVFFSESSSISVGKDTKKFYFDQTNDRKSFTENMTNFLTDAAFRVPFELQARTMALSLNLSLYAYVFDYRGTFSRTSFVTGNNDNIGVTHGDDLNYLFPVKTANVTLTDSDNKMIDIMIDFWTSFAHTGTPSSNHISNPNVWKPFIYDEGQLLKIGDNSDPTDFSEYPLVTERLIFWDQQLAAQLAYFMSLR